jgi:hypothetical protein
MRAAILIFAALAALPVHAEFKDGNKLYAELQGSNMEKMVALGYITGVADSLNGISTCPPSNVTAGQLNDMVLKYLENYPQTRNFTGDALVQRVMSTVWPCKKGSSL